MSFVVKMKDNPHKKGASTVFHSQDEGQSTQGRETTSTVFHNQDEGQSTQGNNINCLS
ncbi:hypothetical protein [Metabacillus schmidteae]|uniref:hypothetical protein n=1 Tax=Metabacillus schmidteae TaxID=2730405 RepID=UPI001589EE74|nr:hypothetical protein [Metabacillus schmidteae]